MKNNGMGKFEVFVIIVLCVAVFSYLTYYLLNSSEWQKVITMKKSGESFSKVTSINRNFFHNRKVVYLGEVIEEGYINNIRSPFSKGNCSVSESRIDFNDDNDNNDYLVTLKCDNYLIDKATILTEKSEVNVYKVSAWQEEEIKGDNVEKKTLYNCMDGGKEKYPEYYEEAYFASRINLDYGADHYDKSTVSECPVVEKVFYRTKVLIKK